MINAEMRQRAARLTFAVWAAFFLVFVTMVYWTVVRGESILAREDNPRLVEAELRIDRGTITDRNGIVLAASVGPSGSAEPGDTVGPGERLTRVYPLPNIGPAVGYYSFRHGTAGIENGLNPLLRGEMTDEVTEYWRVLLHRPMIGGDVQITLDAEWQQRADALLGDKRGAVVLLSLPDGAIRALASHPGYDPNALDVQFDSLMADSNAPLLNRAAQGLYQPGMILQPLLLGAATELGVVDLSLPLEDANRPVDLDLLTLECLERSPEVSTWNDVLRYACPAPMLPLARELGPDALEQLFVEWGLTEPLSIPIETDASGAVSVVDPLLAAAGQEALTITPLHAAAAFGMLANDGRLVEPVLVEEIIGSDGQPRPVPAVEPGPEQLLPSVARRILGLLPVQDGIAEHQALVLSGPAGMRNGWYVGLYPAAAPEFVVVVVIENAVSARDAARIGRGLLTVTQE